MLSVWSPKVTLRYKTKRLLMIGQMAKKVYEDEMKINIYTGEIEPLI